MKKITLLLILSFFTLAARSDHRMSQQEQNEMPAYLLNERTINSGITTPPSSPVRASAEWEETGALMITWTSYPAILTEIARAAQAETQVLIICDDSTAVKNSLTSSSVPLTNIHYIVAPFNTIWCRDYGPWNIYNNDVGSLSLIDWIYNRPRADDDAIPSAIENYTSLPLYQTTVSPNDLIHTGGNFMCDGLGTGFSSRLITDENPLKSEAEIDTVMKKFMGISRYIKMNTLPYDVIHHIDMHIKLLDEETLLVGEYPAGIADGPQIEANIQYILSNYNSVFGTPYKIIRIPMPPDANGDYPDLNGDYRTYTNSVFVNKTVILPFYDERYDTTAVRIYREALPGYTITGINCNDIIPSLGAIHCITKEVASGDPLLISHQPLHDTYVTTGNYNVTALMKHVSGIQSAALYYRTDTLQPYQSVPMNSLSSMIDTWGGQIPAQAAGTTVYYYVEANAVSGKRQVRPITAPQGYWKFKVLLNTSVSVNKDNKMMTIFPNPSAGLVCISVFTNEQSKIILSLKNIDGRTVRTIYNGQAEGNKKYFLDASEMPQGVYSIEMISGNGISTQRLIIN